MVEKPQILTSLSYSHVSTLHIYTEFYTTWHSCFFLIDTDGRNAAMDPHWEECRVIHQAFPSPSPSHPAHTGRVDLGTKLAHLLSLCPMNRYTHIHSMLITCLGFDMLENQYTPGRGYHSKSCYSTHNMLSVYLSSLLQPNLQYKSLLWSLDLNAN